jgi:hypothetical protein
LDQVLFLLTLILSVDTSNFLVIILKSINTHSFRFLAQWL